MNPETQLLADAVEIYRTLVPLLSRLPRQQARAAIRAAGGDLMGLIAQYRRAGHSDADVADALAMFSWLPADAVPTVKQVIEACR